MSEAEIVENISAGLSRVLAAKMPGATGAANLRRLSGGASYETWAFDAVTGRGAVPLILRRAPGGERVHDTALGPEGEARLFQLARAAGVPEPEVIAVLEPGDGIGRGFILTFVEGETLGRKIVQGERFAEARTHLAYDCGVILAQIHKIPVDKCPPMRVATAQGRFEELHKRHKAAGRPRPVFALAFEWLRAHMPPDPPAPKLVHSDFRNGNLIFGEDGVRAVLDWEIAHFGDPIEDLGWLCTGAWRFGGIENPVGGFGKRADLIRGYEAAGGEKVSPDHLKFWELLGSLSWGTSCAGMIITIRDGVDASSDRCMIARRASENEIDLMDLLAPRNSNAG